MARSAPGKHWRKGLSIFHVVEMFPDDETAEAWFETVRWGEAGNPTECPKCKRYDKLKIRESRKPGPYYCGHCRRHFSVRYGTVMQASNIPLRKWALGTYLWATSLKGVSSMKLHRDLDITQKSAWFMAQRLREAMAEPISGLGGPAEVDESWFGGKRRNMSNSKRKELAGTGRGPVGKTAVVGIRDQWDEVVTARVVDDTDKETLQGFIRDTVEQGATVYTDEAAAYSGMEGYDHQSVNHSASEYVRGNTHTNGIESFWALLKRGYHGTFHHVSEKHLHRYVSEFAARHNMRIQDTEAIMAEIAARMVGKRLMYRDLTAD